ncbi:MAG: cytochrome b/b6 domain-containing protein, partial [Pseudomonadota bacterium]
MSRRSVRVWDLSTRLFHWGLVGAVIGSYVSVELGRMDWHLRFGYLVATLLVFRIVWGVLGSDTARFANLLAAPARTLNYASGLLRRGRYRASFGHNPLGGLSAIALVLLLAAQVGTGLFANDDLFFEAPLARLVEKEASDAATGWHGTVFNLLFALVLLHLAAVVFYTLRLRAGILAAMITGRQEDR